MSMSQMQSMNIYNRAIAFYGKDNQFNMASEEFAELIMTLNHFRRGRATIEDIASELVDCYIMLDQLAIIIGVSDQAITDFYDEKMTRLYKRIDDEDKDDN